MLLLVLYVVLCCYTHRERENIIVRYCDSLANVVSVLVEYFWEGESSYSLVNTVPSRLLTSKAFYDERHYSLRGTLFTSD